MNNLIFLTRQFPSFGKCLECHMLKYVQSRTISLTCRHMSVQNHFREKKFCHNFYNFPISKIVLNDSNLLSPHHFTSISKTSIRDFTSDSDIVTVEEALKSCCDKLIKNEVPEAELQAEYIISHILGIDRVNLADKLSRPLTETNLEKMGTMMDCRVSRMPLQYIIGDWDFHSVTLKLRPPVFIPRSETEELVELALKYLDDVHINADSVKVLDVCCGSGAIALAILKNNHKVECVVVDQSEYAINLTRENARDLQVLDRITTLEAKVSHAKLPDDLVDAKFDLIVSNPPYVLRKDTLDCQKEILLYEDMQAIDGGDDGLDVIGPILNHGQHMLKNEGSILLEVDPTHIGAIPALLNKMKIGLSLRDVYKDFSGKERFMRFTK